MLTTHQPTQADLTRIPPTIPVGVDNGAGLVNLADAYAMDITRSWLDTLGNPLWINVIWNSLAVLGVEAAMLLHRGYKVITLSHAEKADKNKHFN